MLIAILFVNLTVSALYLILYIVLHNVLQTPIYRGSPSSFYVRHGV